jgi:hypothetical protein
MIQTKTIVVAVIAIAIGTLGITTTTMSSATASNGAHTDCLSRGLIPGCSPGQHFDANKPGGADILGNPHLPQIDGASTGDPHSSSVCSPATGNPHAGPIPAPPGSHFGC